MVELKINPELEEQLELLRHSDSVAYNKILKEAEEMQKGFRALEGEFAQIYAEVLAFEKKWEQVQTSSR